MDQESGVEKRFCLWRRVAFKWVLGGGGTSDRLFFREANDKAG